MKTNRHYFLSILLYGFIFSTNILGQARIETINYSQNDGLSTNSVNSIVQDKNGFLWIGTEDGLNRFDGYKFKQFRKSGEESRGLSGNYVHQIQTDSFNNLWVRTNEGVLNRMDLEIEKFVHFEKLLHSEIDSINSIVLFFIDANNKFWLFDSELKLYLFSYNDQAPKSKSFEKLDTFKFFNNKNSANWVLSITEDNHKNIWVVFGNNQLYKIAFNPYSENGYDKPILIGDNNWVTNSSNIKYVSIQQDSKNNYWIMTPDSLMVYSETQGILRKWNQNFGERKVDLKFKDKFAYFCDVSGLTRIDLNTFEKEILVQGRKPGLNSKFFSGRTLFIDKQGVLWTGDTPGLCKSYFANKKFRHFKIFNNDDDQSSRNRIRSISNNGSDTVWLGTDFLGLYYFNHISASHHFIEGSDSVFGFGRPQPIWAVHHDKQGSVWFGQTSGDGLVCIKKKQHEYNFGIKELFEQRNINVKSIISTLDSSIWIGSNRGLFSIKMNNEKYKLIHYKNTDPTFNSELNEARTVFAEKDSTFWVGTSGSGFYKFYNGSGKNSGALNHYFVNNSVVKGIGINWINSILKAADGSIWLGTYGGGLARFDPVSEKFKLYTETSGLPNNVIYGIMEDDSGNLWFSSNKGLTRFNIRSEKVTNYSVYDGVQGNEFNSGAYCRNPEGWMFFGGTNGWNMFHPDSIKESSFEPEIVFTDFQIMNKSIAPGEFSNYPTDLNNLDNLIINPDQQVFSFEFAAVNFIQSSKNKYAYKLEGFDTTWQYINDRRFITFTSLSPGHYTLMIKGSNNDGIWSNKIKSLNITVQPYYYQTYWFRGLVVLALLYLMWFSIVLYRRFKRIKKLEQIKMRDQLKKDLHDDLKSDLSAIQSQAELVTKVLNQNDTKKAIAKANDISDLTQNALSTIDDLSWAFGTSGDTLSELSARMKNFVVSILSDSINYELHAPNDNDHTPLPFLKKKHFYLIFKECLQNLKKHAKCQNVVIHWGISENILFLDVKDDGVGFDPDKLARRNGMNHLHERAAEINGIVTISSSRGNGTHISLRVPIT